MSDDKSIAAFTEVERVLDQWLTALQTGGDPETLTSAALLALAEVGAPPVMTREVKRDLDFNESRACLLDALAVEINMTFSAIQRQYDTNQELRRRVDTAALNVSCPGSRSIHPPLHRGRASHRVEAGAPPNELQLRRNRRCYGTRACTHKPTAIC